MKTKAAVAIEPRKPLVVTEVDLEGPKECEVLVEIKASGICHTDQVAMDLGLPSITETEFPFIPGHEGAGIVVEVGPGVSRVEVGDHVVPLYTPHCGSCSECISGKPHYCDIESQTSMGTVMTDGATRFSLDGKPVHHALFCSTFSNFIVTHEAAIAKIRKDVPLDKVCYVGCGVTTGVGAVLNEAKVEPGASVVVFGLGGIGFNVIQGARIAGASQIIGVDVNPSRQVLAQKYGMTDFVNAAVEPNIVEAVHDLTKGGADYCFESAGLSKVMLQAIRAAHPARGHVVLIGAAAPDDFLTIHPHELVLGPTIHGTNFGSAVGPRHVPQYVDWYAEGKLFIDDMITHTMPLNDINRGFDLMHQGESIRSVVTF